MAFTYGWVSPHLVGYRRASSATIVHVEARVTGTRTLRQEDLVFTLPRIAASAAAVLASLALVPALIAGMPVSDDPTAQTHVRKA